MVGSLLLVLIDVHLNKSRQGLSHSEIALSNMIVDDYDNFK